MSNFLKHLKKCSAQVASWPAWKQKLFGGDAQAARSVLVSAKALLVCEYRNGEDALCCQEISRQSAESSDEAVWEACSAAIDSGWTWNGKYWLCPHCQGRHGQRR